MAQFRETGVRPRRRRRRLRQAVATVTRWRYSLAVAGVIGVVTIAAVAQFQPAARVRPVIPAAQAQAWLAATPVLVRAHRDDYRRLAFGDSWTDDNDASGGHNGCDTRNDVLRRDLTHTSTVTITSCPQAIATGRLDSPYTGAVVLFQRGPVSGAQVQIDHIVPLAYAWDLGAYAWPPQLRTAFANDPANLLAVDGDSNQRKGDSPPAQWLPPRREFHCAYAAQFVAVIHTYRLAVDTASVPVLRRLLDTC